MRRLGLAVPPNPHTGIGADAPAGLRTARRTPPAPDAKQGRADRTCGGDRPRTGEENQEDGGARGTRDHQRAGLQ